MKRFCTFIAVLLGLVFPSHAIAGTPYVINWAMVQEDPDCESAHIIPNGGGFMSLNDTPIPTFEVPGALGPLPNGWESNQAQAAFDSVMFRIGANAFGFGVTNSGGINSCVHEQNVVTLSAPTLGIEKVLFSVRRDGSAFSGSTQLDLKLEEINPQLAQDIAILEQELAGERKFLVANANKFADIAAHQDALQQLETELGDLLTRPLDEITADDLDEMLKRYSSLIDDATREALQQVLADLKQSIADLQNELASLMANFGEQADAVSDLLTGDARQTGFNPDDPSNYGLGPNDVPWVDVPDISGVPGAFDPANDPYAAYADGVIASLKENVSGGKVIGRANFVAQVRAWRSNQAALQKAILARMSVSQAETSAFLNAENKVTGYLQQFMNASGWLKDAPVPQDVRADIDGTLKNLYGSLAEDLKDRLNEWDATFNPPEASLFFDTLRAFSAGMQAGDELVEQYRDTMKSIVHGASRVAIGFVPFVGPALDLCEAVTGHEYCMPSGRQLTTGERIFSGIGFGAGKVFKVWKGISTAAISAEGKATAAGIVALTDDVLKVLEKARIQQWKKLTRGSIKATEEFVNEFEPKAVLYLINKQDQKVLAMGGGVQEILEIPKNVGGGVSKAPDALTVSKQGGLVVSEFKYPGKNGVDFAKAELQLKNGMVYLDKKELAGGVERVQLVTKKGVPKGTMLQEVTDEETKEIWRFSVDADGYLLKNGLKVTMPGNPKVFVVVVEIEI